MARLRSGVDDGHIFIRTGRSQGTQQVNEEGIAWLRSYHSIPKQGESVSLDHGTYLRLKDRGYLSIKGIEYDKNRPDPSGSAHYGPETVVEGSPLVLQLKERTNPGWELALDLTDWPEEAWKELQSYHADRVTASDAPSSLLLKRLISLRYLLRVSPSIQFYRIYGENGGQGKHILRRVPETPGLNSTWQGNVFTERLQQRGIWQRRLPERTVSFSGVLLWLAKSHYESGWVGNAVCLGPIYAGWQLWRLTMDEDAPTSWEALKKWFNYRSLSLVEQRQNLEIVSPPTVITDEGRYIVQLDKQVLLACYPPSGFVEGLEKQITLSAELVEPSAPYTAARSRVSTVPFPANQISYFRWSALYAGEYRIRIKGDASADPLLIQVATLPPAQPRWLHGLTCTVSSVRNQQTFQAFSAVPDGVSAETFLQMDQFALEELPVLTWTFEPEQLPMHVTWNAISQHGVQQLGIASILHSGEDLTQCWQDQIWPVFAANLQAKMTLDAGSFGRIALSIVMPQPPQTETEKVWSLDKRLVAQFIWLSGLIGVHRKQNHVPVSAFTRRALQRLSEQGDTDSTFRNALTHLSLQNTLPAWIVFRLRALLTEVEAQGENARTPDTIA